MQLITKLVNNNKNNIAKITKICDNRNRNNQPITKYNLFLHNLSNCKNNYSYAIQHQFIQTFMIIINSKLNIILFPIGIFNKIKLRIIFFNQNKHNTNMRK